jgi:DNA-binding beta-propeller fold protein YncE
VAAIADSIPAPVNQGSDIGSDSVHLWMGSALAGNPVLHKIRIATKTSTSVTPPLLITASEWTGGALWCSAAFTNTLSSIDTATGAILSTSRALGSNIYGLAWDGQYLWAGSQSNSATYVYDPATNSTILTLAGVYGDGMAFAGGYLYLCKNGAIHKCTPSPFRAVASYAIPGYRAYGIAHDGAGLWVTATSSSASQSAFGIYRVTL